MPERGFLDNQEELKRGSLTVMTAEQKPIPSRLDGVSQRHPRRAVPGAMLAALLLTGCGATRISPPAEVLDPVPVFVLDHGRHTSLVLADRDGGLHRYAYGDWRYYAQGDTSLASGLAALFWPTPGALGYRRLRGEADAATVERLVRVGIVELHTLRVERARADALRARLDAIIAQAPTLLPAPDVDLTFVPHPRAYSLAHNSNQVMADWLTELGCQVQRRPLWAAWVVTGAERPR